MAYCTNCGSEQRAGIKFCTECGAELDSSQDTPADDSPQTIHEFRPSWAAWFWPIVLSFGLLAPWAWFRRRGVRYQVTQTRVIKHTGRLSSATEEIRLEDASRIRTAQSFSERLFDVGSIVIDTGVDQLTLSAVPNHERIVQSIRAQQGD